MLKYICMAKDWTKIYKEYKGLWVALDKDEETVVASGKTAKETLKKAQSKGFGKPILNHVPEKIVTYVGFGL